MPAKKPVDDLAGKETVHVGRINSLDKDNLEQPVPDDLMNDANKAAGSRKIMDDPLAAVEADVLNKKRGAPRDDAAVNVNSGVRVGEDLEREEPIRVRDEPMKYNNDDLQAEIERDKKVAKNHDEIENAIDPTVFNKRLKDDEKVNAEVVVKAENKEDSDSDPIDAVEGRVIESKIPAGPSPVTRLDVKATKVGKIQQSTHKDDHAPMLEKGMTAAGKKDQDAIDLIDSGVLARKMEDEPVEMVVDKKNSIRNEHHEPAVRMMEEDKEIAQPKEQVGMMPVLAKEKTKKKDSNKHVDPLDYVDPSVMNKEIPDAPPKDLNTAVKKESLPEPVKDAPITEKINVVPVLLDDDAQYNQDDAKEKEDAVDPLDMVDPRVLTKKMPNEQLARGKTTQVKRSKIDEDTVLTRERTKQATKKETPANKSNPHQPNERDKDLAPAIKKNTGGNGGLNNPIILPVPIVGQEAENERAKHEIDTPMSKDPMEFVDPNVLNNKMGESPENNREINRGDFDQEQIISRTKSKAAHNNPYEDAVAIDNDARIKLVDKSNSSDDPLEAVEPQVFDISPDTKKTPLEILRGLGYDATKYRIDDPIEIDQPAKSVYYLGNVKASQIIY